MLNNYVPLFFSLFDFWSLEERPKKCSQRSDTLSLPLSRNVKMWIKAWLQIRLMIAETDPGVVWVVRLNPLNWNKNIQTLAVFDKKLWWTHWYIASEHSMSSLKKCCDEKEKITLMEQSLFLVFNALLIPLLRKLKSDFLEHTANTNSKL